MITEAIGEGKNWAGIVALMMISAVLASTGMAFLILWLLGRGLKGWRG